MYYLEMRVQLSLNNDIYIILQDDLSGHRGL